MSRDEARALCIEAIETAIIGAIIDAGGTLDVRMTPVGAAAFDALHGIATVNPPSCTAEMVEAGDLASEKSPEGDMITVIFNAMSAAGDLTNGPENKRYWIYYVG